MLPPRRRTGIAELDRVCGGGFVPGSAILVGGDPGIGKSTLLLQAAAAIAASSEQPASAAYITGEEAIDQVRLRAQRLGVAREPGAARRREQCARHPRLARSQRRARSRRSSIRSRRCISTRSTARPGTVSQVRGAAQELIRLAKRRGFVLVLVGHVTKEGVIAGPARARAHGRHRALFRGRARPPVPHPARGQEPLWRDRRDRRLRDERSRAGRGAKPVGVVSRRASGRCRSARRQRGSKRRRAGQRLGRVRRHRRHAAGAGRSPGAGRAGPARHAAARGRRLGRHAAGDDHRGARRALRAVGRRQRHLSQRRRRLAHRRAGGGSGGGRGSGLGAERNARFRPTPWCLARSRLSGEVRPVGHSEARLKEAAKLGFAEAWMPKRGGRRTR